MIRRFNSGRVPHSDPKQGELARGARKQQGGFPHKDGGSRRSEKELIRADAYVESQPGGQRDDLMDKANQRRRRSTAV